MNDKQFKNPTNFLAIMCVLITLGIVSNIILYTRVPLKVEVINFSAKVDTVYVKNVVITLPHPDYKQEVNIATIRGYEPSGYKDRDGNIILAVIDDK